MSLGNIQGCFKPNRIINPYTDEVMYVECRKCPACRNRYAYKWQERVSKECTFHRYSMFVTLTYSNDNLPRFQMVWNDALDNYQMLSNRDCDFDKVLPEEYNGLTHQMAHDTKDGVPYVCRYDVVTFFKRFRARIDYSFKINNINENKTSVISSVPSIAPKVCVRIITLSSGLIPNTSPENSEKSYLKVGRMVLSTIHLSTHQPPTMWQNTLLAILVCQRFYSLNLPVHSTSKVKSHVSDLVRLIQRNYSKMSLMELMDTLNLTLPLNLPYMFNLPVRLRCDTSQSVKAGALYLILKNYEFIRLQSTLKD